jgi:hypothetical protein
MVIPPGSGWSRETKIRRDARGRWFDGDEPIGHPGIEKAFDRWIDRAEDGRFILRNSVNWAYVAIEGAPLFVRQVVLDDLGAQLVLSDGRTERLDPATLRQGADGQIYCTARGGTMAAAFDRGAAMQLGAAAESDDEVMLGGQAFKVPLVEDPTR